MSGVGSTTEVSSAKEQQPKNDMGDAVNSSKCVAIDIRDEKSGAIECTFRMRRSRTLQKIYEVLRVRRGGDSFILKFGERNVPETDTPDALGIGDHAELTYVPCVLVRISGAAIAGPFKLRRSQMLQKIHDVLRKRRGGDSFILKLGERNVLETDTPDSLGIDDDAAELTYVPCALIGICDEESVAIAGPFKLRRSQRLQTVYDAVREWKGGDSFILMLGERPALETDTPKSIGMKNIAELTYVPYVLIKIRDEESVAIARPFKLRRSQMLQQVYDAVREWRGEEDSFILKLGEESVGYWDTPDSLEMGDQEELTCVPDTNMACAEEDDSTIDIVFFNQVSSEINHVVLRHGYNEKMKILFSRYAAMREIPLKSLRFKSDNKVLFLSSIGKKSPRDLGMQNNDVIYASRFESIGMKRNEIETIKKCRPSQGVGTKKGKAKSKKKTTNQPSYSTMNEEERLRREHSKMLTIVFDEANPLFKEIRQKLNSLFLEQTQPKVKLLSPRIRARQPTSADLSDISSVSLDNKAVKTRFNVIVGEVGNLYKSTKPSKNIKAHEVSFTIDLHGYSKEAAVRELDASLPSWVDAAMHGDYPFVIPVTIICGAGGQVLSEVVEKWIRENERVANARKNIFI